MVQFEMSKIWFGSCYEIDSNTCMIADMESNMKNDLYDPYSIKSTFPKKCLPSVI